jgi:hypothetical protein
MKSLTLVMLMPHVVCHADAQIVCLIEWEISAIEMRDHIEESHMHHAECVLYYSLFALLVEKEN